MTNERKKFYIELIENSNSIAEVCRKANISQTTGNYNTIKDLIERENISISHFKRNAKGKNNVNKINLEDILKGEKCTITSYNLKNRILAAGIKECKCECCGSTIWLGKPIPLELHHIDGDNKNNKIDNLQLLCPNCHTLTNNYGGKNIKLTYKKCKVCGKSLEDTKGVFCSVSCRNKFLYDKKIGEVTKEKLLEALNSSFTVEEASIKIERSERNLRRIAKTYDVNVREQLKPKCNINDFVEKLIELDNLPKTLKYFSISRKWLRSRGYPTKKEDLILFIKK